jgi:anti-anti-sigma regulatory factor
MSAMLRITVEEEPRQITLRLEGRLAGAWVKELEDAWREVDSQRNARFLLLDFSAVDHVDQAGEYLLALMARRGVQLVASGVAMSELSRKIAAGWPHTAAPEP